MVPDDHAEISFNLGGSIEKLKDHVVTLKEGSSYRIKLEFYVQRDIISGLRFVQSSYKGPIRTDKSVYMLGSRAPKGELQEYTSEKEITPSGNPLSFFISQVNILIIDQNYLHFSP